MRTDFDGWVDAEPRTVDGMSQADQDRELYARLVRSHAAELYGLAYRLTGCVQTAEDLVQETFCEAWRSIGSLHDPQGARAWLFQILRYRYAHLVRHETRRIVANRGLNDESRAAADPRSDAHALATRDLLQQALDALDERHRQPFMMVFVEGLTCAETAGQLDVPLGTVLSRIHRARQLLRGHLRRLDPEIAIAENTS